MDKKPWWLGIMTIVVIAMYFIVLYLLIATFYG